MNEELKVKMYSVTIDCRDHRGLGAFYAKLLGWKEVFYDEDYSVIGAPGAVRGAYPCITFQKNPDYQAPVWPDKKGSQQQMAHLDLAVNDLESAVSYAVSCGAKTAEEQFSDDWVVMLDPEGHPFCLFESVDFALL